MTELFLSDCRQGNRRSESLLRQALIVTLLVLSILLLQAPSHASEVMLIGGGSQTHNSSVRFEDSVRWISQVLTDEEVSHTSHFTDGDSDEADVFSTSVGTGDRQPLSRVFDNAELQTRVYRNHDLPNVSSSTSQSTLEAELVTQLQKETEEELILVFSGRGSYNGHAEDAVSMHLWNDSHLDANRLHQLIHEHSRPVRFVFAHGHSGGFHRLAYRDAASGIDLASTTQCGFTSQSAYGYAETGTNSQSTDYRDYLSYFFSAVSGYEHDGEIISRFADLDKDGQISLREAHLFSLEEARSIDQPLSSSEDYLLRWQPWYLRWQPARKRLPNNEYTRIFRDLSAQLDVSLHNNAAAEIRHRLAMSDQQLRILEQRKSLHLNEVGDLRSTLQSAVLRRWPALSGPYTQSFETLVKADIFSAVDTFIERMQPQYNQLTTLQEQVSRLDVQILDKRREASQYHKLLRLRRLALLKQQLQQHGSARHRKDYSDLLACERAPLGASIQRTLISEDTTS